MTLEQIKSELIDDTNELVKTLQIRDCRTAWDDELQQENIYFNEWSILESFSDHVLNDLYVKITRHIDNCRLYELDEEKSDLLVELVIKKLEFEDYIYSKNYNDFKPNLSGKQNKKLSEFERKQEGLRKRVKAKLEQKYLTEKKFDTRKIAKLNWKGDQTELMTLFLELEQKNWIEKVPNRNALYRTIATMFQAPNFETFVNNLKDYATKGKTTAVFKTIPSNKLN